MEEENLWNTYCPCCPFSNIRCACECNCTKTKTLIPSVVLSSVSLIFIIISSWTKVSDTNTYIHFKENDLKEIIYEEYINDFEKILRIESIEDKLTLALIIIAIYMTTTYIILQFLFIKQKSLDEKYNLKCKRPYYQFIMITNLLSCLANGTISILFFGYRINSIAQYKNYTCFDKNFRKKNDLNFCLNIISFFCYLACLILDLITCCYLSKQDKIFTSCCEQFIAFCGCNKEKNENERNKTLAPVHTQSFNRTRNNQNLNFANHNVQEQINNEDARTNYDNQFPTQERNNLKNNNNEVEELKKKIDAKFKKLKFNEVDICLECSRKFKNDDEVYVLTCGHLMHKYCCYHFFKSKKICPKCYEEIQI